jgi:RimJ/RimL family protein N-acetyltransferase
MAFINPILLDVPMPIQTPRLILRPKQSGDGETASAAVAETWDDLRRWMSWAEDLGDFSIEKMETHARQAMARLILREDIQMVGIEKATGAQVITCGLHRFDWQGPLCEIGYWVRKSAQGRGFATEAANALVRYAFGALRMKRITLTCASENIASKRVAERLNFLFEGLQKQAEVLPGRTAADRLSFARFDIDDLPELEVRW